MLRSSSFCRYPRRHAAGDADGYVSATFHAEERIRACIHTMATLQPPSEENGAVP